MRRFLTVVLAGAVLGALAVAPARATTAGDWRCEERSFSTTGQQPMGYGFVGKSGPGAANHYWMEERVVFESGKAEYRFETAFRVNCGSIFFPPVTTLITPVSASGQLPCISPGNYSEVVDGKIVDHRLIGAKTSLAPFKLSGTTYWLPSNYRYWHTMRQDSPGVWHWSDSSVAKCPA
ncbi:hypothetical protein SAMN05421504_101842 [Amycolatopsis xylanica]|uniref:Secreted protein n=1 Tax=Amycolatopsis xylanica TaxID=589385 RepID=A0A1H2UBV4_9PSEU|nr:hypothetical protein [Amycolatopsis xylanica]SDW53560.1 hypothetical protein SAMN05421504_101842 [Amycolatopsis xylanica]